ncbi:glycosyltransferase [Allorhizocola rhizosphaerae]|uniref:glycosyltransferase n=1 Tax=Allorhizocola rhizosphaerae TaxID=1872709 RepID=UPI0013C341E7|nr:glycosyltransferase [Allorhizocola rhizosphaerae]
MDATKRRPIRVGMLVISEYESDARVRRQAEALVERGDEVTVVALHAEGRPAVDVVDGVNVVHLPTQKYRGESSLSYIKLYGGFTARAAGRMARWGRRFDVVQAHSMPEALVFAAAVQRAMRVPVLLDVHDLTSELFSAKFEGRRGLMSAIRFSERASFRFADEVLTPHDRYTDMLRAMTRTPVTTVMNCPDDRYFTARPWKGWEPGGEVVFGYHGLIAPRHGLAQLAEALAAVRGEVPGARMQVWGSGDGLAPLREKVAELRLGDAVSLPTRLLPIHEMTKELDKMHIGVLASQLDPWTANVLPNKLMEYAVMGIPVITFRNATIERYFPDDAVTYVDPANPANLREAMLALIRDPEKARLQAERAREVMVGRTWRHQRQHYYEVIDRMAARRRD